MAGYLGDKETMLVHHLASMKQECSIYNIKTENRQYFTPDSLDVAKEKGFKPCQNCN